MSKVYHGKCHCGAIEWDAELAADGQRHVVCHCNACQVIGGGAFTLNQVMPKDKLKLTKGSDKLNKYTYKGDSGNPVDCFFCSVCGSNPYHHQHVLGDNIVIRTSLLEGTHSWDKPALEIFGKDKFSWQPQTGDNLVPGPPPS